ncbi:MAG: hypothetical protein WCK00_18410, partial [Deltaproteobacteria bacterium]
MAGRALLVMVVGIIVISSAIFLNITSSTGDIMENVDRAYQRHVASNIAQSGVNLGLRQFSRDVTWRAGFPMMDVFGGKLFVRVVDTVWALQTAVKIEATGIVGFGTTRETKSSAVAYLSPGYLPPTIKG